MRFRRSGLVVMLAVLACLGVACSTSDEASPSESRPTSTEVTTTSMTLEDFYDVDVDASGEVGSVIRERTLTEGEFDGGLNGTRILYVSTDAEGAHTAVSGVVLVPDGDAPQGGWPVLAWAHGTTGVADQCAPSRSKGMFGYANYLGDLVRSGFVVVASDYEGLGTPGVHPYLDKNTEGRNVVDSVTAARSLLTTHGVLTTDSWLVIGHSQGGQAALATGEMTDGGTAEPPVGLVAVAPASNLPLLPDFLRGTPYQGYLAFAAAGIVAADPSVTYEDLFGPIGLERVDVLEDGCWTEVMDAFETVPVEDTMDQTPAGAAAIERFLESNEPGTEPIGVPILLVQGEADQTVPLVATTLLRDRLCDAGETVELDVVPDMDHDEVLDPSLESVVSWINDRFGGQTIIGCD